MSQQFSNRARPLNRKINLPTALLCLIVALAVFVGDRNSCLLQADNPSVLPQAKATSLDRVSNDIRYLASDELKGRRPGTPEMELAENHIAVSYTHLTLPTILLV